MAKLVVEGQHKMNPMDQTIEAECSHPPDFDPSMIPHGEDGVDVTLIDWMLSMTPAERLQVLQRHVRAVLKLRHDNPQL